MAKTTIITCDVCTEGGASTTRLTVDEEKYVLDLCQVHRKELMESLRTFLVGVVPSTTKRKPAKASGVDLAAVRTWALEEGWEVSSRGRIRQEVLDAYRAAQPKSRKRG